MRIRHPVRAWIAALIVVVALPTTAAETPVSPETFFRHPDYWLVRLSPSGRYVGAIVPVQGRQQLAVIDLDARKSQVIAGIDGHDIGWFDWVHDGRLVFNVWDLQSGLGEQRGGGLFAVNRDGGEFKVLASTAKAQFDRGHYVNRYTAFLSRIDDGGDDILVVSNDVSERYPDAYRLNTSTGRRTVKSFDKPGNVVEWIGDRKGAIRAAVTDERSLVTRVWWRPTEDAKWEKLGEYGLRDARIVPVAFDGDGTLIVASNVDRDTFALYRYDTAKKALGEMLAGHERIDLTNGLLYDRQKKQIVGVAYDAERLGVAWFDDEWARIGKGVDNALPGTFNFLQRGDNGRVLITSMSDQSPSSWHLLDLNKRQVEFLATQRKSIKPDAQPARQAIRYKARDGLEIPAFLTLPKGRDPKNLALIVNVHGGPNVRGEHWLWNPEAAYLAALGYAVLQPEFRGSMGWGKKLFEAGWKQWGGAMQDDLNDGVDWLVGQGIVDPKRVCIMGASYGGYAVMMGLARDPERWKCGINIVGVTDINLMFTVAWSDFADSDYIRYAAREVIGDPDRDAAMLKAASPLENAAKIRAPVLMAYGGQDYRVPSVHGERMRDALVRQGTPVEWVLYPDEGHGFLLEKNRFDFYGRVGAFLNRHLPATR